MFKKDRSGQVFGRLTVVSFQINDKKRNAIWLCRCECGSEIYTSIDKLLSGNTKSCGCLRLELSRERFKTHGFTKTITYKTWKSMRQRCKKDKAYIKNKITVCPRWANSFENFLADMGERPGLEYSIERKKNSLNYTPENCCWILKTHQYRNRSCSKFLTFNNQTLTITEWSEISGIKRRTIQNRIDDGWPAQRAIFEPLGLRMKSSSRITSFNGVTKNLSQWAENLGITQSAISTRIKRGWSVEKAITTPRKLRWSTAKLLHNTQSGQNQDTPDIS